MGRGVEGGAEEVGVGVEGDEVEEVLYEKSLGKEAAVKVDVEGTS